MTVEKEDPPKNPAREGLVFEDSGPVKEWVRGRTYCRTRNLLTFRAPKEQ
jgi:hypothetical protein